MLTFCVILAIVVAVLAVIGGASMMMSEDGCLFSWYIGLHAVQSGFEILAKIVPAIFEAVVESDK